MQISGLQKLTLLDFPDRTACTVFTYGCNFRCPFCHNASLVVGKSPELLSEEGFFSFLQKRKGVLDGVAITGGEPTLQKDLIPFIERIKETGFAVKLDTNGARPEVLRLLLERGLVDYVAMDVKNSPDKYALTAGCTVDMGKIFESVALLQEGKTDFEFRTTVVKGFHEEKDFEKIGKWIAGEEKYFLQKFTDSGDILGKKGEAFGDEEMKNFCTIVRPFVPKASLRGI